MEKEESLNNLTIPTEQLKRSKSAEEALAKGCWRYWQDGTTWKVETPTDTYTIASSPAGSLVCSCADHRQYGPLGLDCKHLCGLALWINVRSEQNKSTGKGDSPMTDNPVAQIVEQLNRPLDTARVKWREAARNEQVPYLEGYDVIASANDVFEYRWSFETGEPQVRQWQRAVTRWDKQSQTRIPVLGKDGQPLTEQVGIAWITGRVAVHLDGQAYVHSDVGRCTFTGDTPEAFDMAISGCATDCLKRCFRQLGRQFGNDLYDKDSRAELAGAGTGKRPAPRQTAPEPITLTLEQARSVPCPMAARSHPEYKGLALEQVAQAEDGIKVLEYLAGDQYRPNGDRSGHRAKAAARLLLETLQPAA
jgi:Rad52/22 family double-strand break repair protein